MICVLSFPWGSSHFRFSWQVAAKDRRGRRAIQGPQARKAQRETPVPQVRLAQLDLQALQVHKGRRALQA
jgi:hypothetical protein